MPTSDHAPQPADPTLADAIRTAVSARFAASLEDLEALVRIPSVSWDGFDPSAVDRSADAVAALFRDTALFDTVEVVRHTVGDYQGRPAVVGRRPARNGRPTILLYAHHDVQPEGSADAWATPPYEPTRAGDRLFGRGAADDKAGVVLHLASLRALVDAVGPDPDIGIALFIEGEEEFGSGSFGAILDAHGDLLAADAVIVADSDNWDEHTPAITVGLRGGGSLNVTVSTLDHPVHSGGYGGAVPDAMIAAIRMLDSLWTADGEVAVAGLAEEDFDYPDYGDDRLREESGLLPGVSPIGGGHILSRLWAKPSITVTGADLPSVAHASNTLLSSVRFRVSVRIAPSQDPIAAHRAVAEHLRAHTPFGARVEIDGDSFSPGYRADAGGWATALLTASLGEGWGHPTELIGIGGSIPFINDLLARFPDTQVLITGVEDADSRAHSPNESLLIPTFEKAIVGEALFLASANSATAEELATN
jgi:cysteinylglycine-S-conjugate dipeptidase